MILIPSFPSLHHMGLKASATIFFQAAAGDVINSSVFFPLLNQGGGWSSALGGKLNNFPCESSEADKESPAVTHRALFPGAECHSSMFCCMLPLFPQTSVSSNWKRFHFLNIQIVYGLWKAVTNFLAAAITHSSCASPVCWLCFI